jgi:hypothetical protein
MSEVRIGNFKLNFTYRGLLPETSSLIPRLQISIEIILTATNYPLTLIPTISKLDIFSEDRPLYITSVVPDQPFYEIEPASPSTCYFYADLDHFKLNEIEKVRKGEDLRLRLHLSFLAEVRQPIQQPITKYPIITQLDERTAKSDWIETISQLRFKDVALIEIPKIEAPEFSDVISKVNGAWKQYWLGEYDKVLTECRKAMESLTEIVKNEGFIKEELNEKGKRTVPDFEKALGHKDTGEIIKIIIQKHFGFLAPGSHYGKSINREDAEFALILTQGLVNFISKKLVKGE